MPGLKLKERMVEPAWVKDAEVWAKASAVAAKYSSEPGYEAIVTQVYKGMGGKVKSESEMVTPSPVEAGNAKATDLVVQNPGMSAPTLLNTMKANGLQVVDTTQALKTEADSSSSMPAAVRAGVRKESMNLRFQSLQLLESAASDDGIGYTRFKTILIQEGLGNLRDGFYYTREALESAVPVFEGKKIYADHPSSMDEQTRPERSVRDVLGYFENVQIEEGKDGRTMLTASVTMLDDPHYAWARGLMRYAVNYSKKFPDKDFVGLSINATGDAEAVKLDDFAKESWIPETAVPKILRAKEDGLETVRLVNRITEAISCDLVTEAGAGGRILEMIEQEKKIMAKKSTAKVEKKVLESEEPKKDEVKKEASQQEQHDDEKQDAELIKSMLKKYVGGGDEGGELDESDVALAKEMYYAAKEMGYEGEECEKAAGAAMKMTKHLAAKKAESLKKESEEKPGDEKKEAATEEAAAHPAEAADPAAETKEAASTDPRDTKILELTARLGTAESELRDIKLVAHVDRKCKESGLPNSLTTKFKEALGKPKTEKEIDDKLKLFVETVDLARKESTSSGLILGVEKVGETPRNVDFNDCLRN
jgi:hypothetical protein